MSEHRLLTNKTELHLVTILGAVACALILTAFIIGHKVSEKKAATTPTVDHFEQLTLSAKAVEVYDVRADKILFAKHADLRMPLASLVKVMTAVLASDLAPESERIKITSLAVSTSGDSGLQVGEIWSLKNLVDFSLTSSSNDGARAIGLALGALSKENATEEEIEADFVRAMNVKANELGMKNTYFLNDTGLDLPPDGSKHAQSGAYGTARDMTTLFAYILKKNPDLMIATREPVVVASSNIIVHRAKNTDSLVSYIPGIKASKTGFTDLAGGNLVVAFDPEIGRPIIISILGSTELGRFDDMIKLVNASLKSIQTQ